jgi:hypothetical protein
MSKGLRYIELKSGYSDDGPAWIAYVEFSKSKKMIYFDGKAISCGSRGGHDIETGESYWVSGVKKTSSNRHIWGKGIIQVEESAIVEYEELTDEKVRNNPKYCVVKIEPTDKEKFTKILNEKL